MSEADMKPERQLAVRAMQNMGWTAERRTDRRHPYWRFCLGGTNGWQDVATVPQSDLSMDWVARIAVQYGLAPDLAARLKAVTDEWARERFKGLYAEFQVPK